MRTPEQVEKEVLEESKYNAPRRAVESRDNEVRLLLQKVLCDCHYSMYDSVQLVVHELTKKESEVHVKKEEKFGPSFDEKYRKKVFAEWKKLGIEVYDCD